MGGRVLSWNRATGHDESCQVSVATPISLVLDKLQAVVYDSLPLEKCAGKRCSESNSKHWFTTSLWLGVCLLDSNSNSEILLQWWRVPESEVWSVESRQKLGWSRRRETEERGRIWGAGSWAETFFLFKKVVVCGHCLVTLSITSYWNIKMALVAVHLNAGVILVETV